MCELVAVARPVQGLGVGANQDADPLECVVGDGDRVRGISGHVERAQPAQLDELGGITGDRSPQLGNALGQGGAGLAVDLDLLLQLVFEQLVGGPFEAVLDGEQPLFGHDMGGS